MKDLRKKSLVLVFSIFAAAAVRLFATEPAFDPIFVNEHVVQANFASDPTSMLPTRIFGTGNPSKLSVKLVSDPAEKVRLNGQRLTAAATTFTLSATQNRWEWSGTFSIETAKPCKVQFELEGGSRPSLTAYLGEVWMVAGGQNVDRKKAVTEGSQRQPPPVWIQIGPPLSSPVAPTSPPLLAELFAKALYASFQRPIAVYPVLASRAVEGDWQKDSAVWNPLRGGNPAQKTISTRGIVWWTGDWNAEQDDFPEAGLPEAISTSSEKIAQMRFAALSQWTKEKTDALVKIMRGYAEMAGATGTAAAPSPPLHLVVQLQAVGRKPSTLEEFSQKDPPESVWELMRAAQAESTRAMGANAQAGPQAVLLTTLVSSGTSNRWYFDDSEGAARLDTLAKDLAQTAWEIVSQTSATVPPPGGHPPEVDWSDPSNVKIKFSSQFSSTNGGSINLKYATMEAPQVWQIQSLQWQTNTTFTISAPTPVIRIKYGDGDAPDLPVLKSGTQTLVVPAFQSFRPNVTWP